MRKFTREMDWDEFARFLFENLNDPTEGLILDAMIEEGASSEEADAALRSVRDMYENPQIDVDDDLDEDEPPVDDEPVEDRPLHPELDRDEVEAIVSDYIKSDPNASSDDVAKYLVQLGIPEHEARGYAGMSLVSAVTAGVSYEDAAKWVYKENDTLTPEDVYDSLIEVGAPKAIAESVIDQLPPREDPMDMAQTSETPMEPGMESSPFQQVADSLMQRNPTMPPEQLVQELVAQGASPEEAQQIANNLAGNTMENMQTNARVKTPDNQEGVVLSVYDTLYGRYASVQLDSGEVIVTDDIELAPERKVAATEDDFSTRVARHFEEKWYDSMETLPKAYKSQYEERLAATEALIKEGRAKIGDAGPEKYKIDEDLVALEAEACFCKERLKNAFTEEEVRYAALQPKFHLSKNASRGNGLGPGGGEAIVFAAEETLRDAETRDWRREVTAGAELFVDDISPVLIANAGAVRKLAVTYIDLETTGLEAEDRRRLRKEFLANVESARRVAAREARTSASNKRTARRNGLPENTRDEGLF